MKSCKIVPNKTNRKIDSLNRYLSDIAKEPLLTVEDEIELSNKIINEHDEKAIQALIKGNLRFAVSIAKQYQHQGLSLGDLIGYANIGLARAATDFDATKGFKFISYAVWWIRQSIMEALTKTSRSIRLPANQIADLEKLSQLQSEWFQDNNGNNTLSIEEIAKAMNITEDKVRMYLSLPSEPVSLETPITDNDECTLMDITENKETEIPDSNLIKEGFNQEIKQLFDELLNEREKKIIIEYYGLFGESTKTHEQLAKELGLTRERIRQCRAEALRKLRNSKKINILKEYL